MIIEDLIIEGKKHLPSQEAKMLLAYINEYDSLELLLHLDEEVSLEKCEEYIKLIKARLNNYPIQYLVGDVNLLRNKIKVNEHVLNTRYVTENLVNIIIKKIKQYFNNNNLNIIDLGTGSGCIAISLKKAFPSSRVSALDISSDALEVAKGNARCNNVEIEFYLGDMSDHLNEKYDVIISNPPYIEEGSTDVEKIVFNNEPHLALYAPNRGLYFYEEILKKVKDTSKEKCMIIFEIGYNQGESLKELCNKYLPNYKFVLEQDMSGKDRFVFIYR